jgi:hypothetical protein
MQALKWLTIGMGVLIVAGVITLAALLAGRTAGNRGAAWEATLVAPDEQVESMSSSGDRIVLLDVRNGRQTGRLLVR